MPRGSPDWGSYAALNYITPLADMGELAVRLGSPTAFDRRGYVTWFDDFDNGIEKFTPAIYRPDGFFELANWLSKWGQWSGHIYSGTGGGAGVNVAFTIGVVRLSRFGFELSFFPSDLVTSLFWSLSLFDGVKHHSWVIHIDVPNHNLFILDADGVYYVFTGGINLYTADTTWHVAKLVVDPTDDRYVRFILNQTEFDISAYAARSIPSNEQPHLTSTFQINGESVNGGECYIDGWIMTEFEP